MTSADRTLRKMETIAIEAGAVLARAEWSGPNLSDITVTVSLLPNEIGSEIAGLSAVGDACRGHMQGMYRYGRRVRVKVTTRRAEHIPADAFAERMRERRKRAKR